MALTSSLAKVSQLQGPVETLRLTLRLQAGKGQGHVPTPPAQTPKSSQQKQEVKVVRIPRQKKDILAVDLEPSATKRGNDAEHQQGATRKKARFFVTPRPNVVQKWPNSLKRSIVIQLDCAHCQMSFGSRQGRIHHERTHTAEKPYKCSFCNRCFSQIGNLKTHHQRAHSNEPFYVCAFCGKRFELVQPLANHIKSEHGMDRTQKESEADYLRHKYNLWLLKMNIQDELIE